jgi:hypothetical protein
MFIQIRNGELDGLIDRLEYILNKPPHKTWAAAVDASTFRWRFNADRSSK